MRRRGAGASAQPARSISPALQRARAAITGPRTWLAIIRTPSASASEAIGNPASMTSTPSAARRCASFSFSSVRIEKPGACSPSRNVVSKMVIRLPTVPPRWELRYSAARARSPIYSFLCLISFVYTSRNCMNLHDLTAFAAVAEERSFSRAARRLHRTQPAVSQAVRRLEEELGDRLFDRSSRNTVLTEAGTLLLDHASRLLRLATDARAAVRELHDMKRGRVIIGANEAAVHAVLPVIRDFTAEHPQV